MNASSLVSCLKKNTANAPRIAPLNNHQNTVHSLIHVKYFKLIDNKI